MPGSSAVFVDTSGWIAILNADDRFHAQASEQLPPFCRAVRDDDIRAPFTHMLD